MILQTCNIGHEVVGMGKHLHMLVLPQVEVHITIDGLRLATLQFLDHHVESLLIVFYQLGLRRVSDPTDARWQYIVDRHFVVVLFNVYRTNLQRSAFSHRGIQALLVDAPLATHQIE